MGRKGLKYFFIATIAIIFLSIFPSFTDTVNFNIFSTIKQISGSQTRSDTEISNSVKTLGEQKISGARQLSRSGYKESSIIAAKEVFRNYPNIADMFNERIYFADLLGELELYEEALEDYKNISNLDLNEIEREILEERIENTSSKLMENN